jgi:hypothetical protein
MTTRSTGTPMIHVHLLRMVDENDMKGDSPGEG